MQFSALFNRYKLIVPWFNDGMVYSSYCEIIVCCFCFLAPLGHVLLSVWQNATLVVVNVAGNPKGTLQFPQ